MIGPYRCAGMAALLLGIGVFDSRIEAQEKKPEKEPDIGYDGTPLDVVEAMLELAKVGPCDVVYDLGCGDGRFVVSAAKTFGARAVGVDIDPKRIRESRDNVARNCVGRLATIRKQDIFEVDLSRATVVTLYLFPDINKKLVPQIEKMPPGSRIVAHAFEIPGYVPDRVVEVKTQEDGSERTVYLWTTPLKRAEQ